jgi:hypothetical protein
MLVTITLIITIRIEVAKLIKNNNNTDNNNTNVVK